MIRWAAITVVRAGEVGAGEVAMGEVGTGEVAEAVVTDGGAVIACPATHETLS